MITFIHVIEAFVMFIVCMSYVAHASYRPKHKDLPSDWKHEL